MSRLAKKPINIPQGVTVEVNDGTVKVRGPKGELTQDFLPYVKIEIEDGKVWIRPNEAQVRRKSDWRKVKMFQGTYWSLIRNMVIGVTEGYKKSSK